MVQVRDNHPLLSEGDLDIDSWINRLLDKAELSKSSGPALRRACVIAQSIEGQAVDSGDLWAIGIGPFKVGMEMADILADLKLDQEALCAAILYRCVRENRYTLDELKEQFGEEVSRLVEGVQRMAVISGLRSGSDDDVLGEDSTEQSENIRKMLVSIVDDVRVALIKIAERACALRAVKDASEERRVSVGKEVAEVYAPLAHRLGIGHLKWELEDLSFRYLEPESYKRIAKLLGSKRLAREEYIKDVVTELREQLSGAGIEGEVNGRVKHIYSIWRKMRRKDIGFSQLYDIRAVRILVPTVRDCYGVLGIVHNLWRNIPAEFDDYIASPKENGYRSLHTAVIGPERKVLEVQIRTSTMHDEAEYGVCAHWRYKGTDKDENTDSYEQKIEWLRSVLEWQEEWGGNPLGDDLGQSIEQTRIYVFTRNGHVVDLPAGATVLDFAYRIHTEVGHCCRGAKINGRIVPLNATLKTSDQIEILTGKNEAPSRDWLIPGSGYITTSRARSKIHHWFKQQARESNITAGRGMLERELKRLALHDVDLKELAEKLKFKEVDDLFVALGASDLGIGHVLNVIQQMINPDDGSQMSLSLQAPKNKQVSHGSDVYIDGVGNLLTQMAGCCHPLPGDAIVGYITQGRGVSIHRQDCENLLQLQSEESERIIRVSWGEDPGRLYPVDIEIDAFDRHGLLRDVATLLDKEKINIIAAHTSTDRREHRADMVLTIEVPSFTELSRVLNRLTQLSNVVSAWRKR